MGRNRASIEGRVQGRARGEALGRNESVAKLAAIAGILLFGAALVRPATTAQALALWYWHHSELTTDSAVEASKRLIDRAARAGYTGLAFWDNTVVAIADPAWPAANVRRLAEVMRYANSKGLRVMGSSAPFGWSNGALAENGNLAEGQRVIGANFRVDRDGQRLNFENGLEPLRNSGFEDGHTEWFDTGDAATGLSAEAHTGKQAATIVDAEANARLRQKVTLTPWRQYHLSLWFKSKNFSGPAAVEILDWWHRGSGRFYAEIPVRGTHDWTRLDYTFDSQDTGWAYLYFGIWGRSKGVLWFDDVRLEETAPVYVLRRPGTPLRVYNPERPAETYREERDFERIADPAVSAAHAVFRDMYHAPVTVHIPGGSRLKAGDRVAMDYHAAFPIPNDAQMAMCLTEPAVFAWMGRHAQALRAILPESGAVLLGYDEMRQGNSCASCRAKGMTAGELLAWNAKKTATLFEKGMPGTQLYTWSDMFDPLHNAHDHYYLVEGDLAGSWKGLPKEVGVLNWNHPHLRDSLRWFAGVDERQPVRHRQIIAGYYDSGRPETARTDFETAAGIPGIEGIMYTSWKDDYSQLERFAEAARTGWASYQQSIQH